MTTGVSATSRIRISPGKAYAEAITTKKAALHLGKQLMSLQLTFGLGEQASSKVALWLNKEAELVIYEGYLKSLLITKSVYADALKILCKSYYTRSNKMKKSFGAICLVVCIIFVFAVTTYAVDIDSASINMVNELNETESYKEPHKEEPTYDEDSSAVDIIEEIESRETEASADIMETKETDSSKFPYGKSYLHDEIFKYILNDFIITTDISEDEAYELYRDISENGFSVEEVNKAEIILYGQVMGYHEEDNIEYVQENYRSIITRLSLEEKQLLDKYTLNATMIFYAKLSSPEKYAEANLILDNAEKSLIYGPTEPIIETTPRNGDPGGIIDSGIIEDATEATYDEPGAELQAEKVAELRIFSSSSSPSSSSTTGHAWISITNITNRKIVIGKFSVAPNRTFTFGTWSIRVNSEHNGIWYSLEASHIRNTNAYTDRKSLMVRMTQDMLNAVNSLIAKNDTWNEINNCSSFAVRIWNMACSYKLGAGLINNPTTLKNSIAGHKYSADRARCPQSYAIYYANGEYNVPIKSRLLN